MWSINNQFKNKIKKIALLFIAVLLLVVPFKQIEAIEKSDLEMQIQILLEQIVSLQSQILELQPNNNNQEVKLNDSGEFVEIEEFRINLWYGLVRNSEVVRLQSFLIKKGFLSSGLNTGNYFSKTLEAVKSYQRTQGVIVTGYFGPLTRSSVNSELVQERSLYIVESEESDSLVVVDNEKNESHEVLSLDRGSDIEVFSEFAENITEVSEQVIKDRDSYNIDPRPVYDLNEVSRKIQDRINILRIENSLVPLGWKDDLSSVALLHSMDQSQDNIIITDSNKPCSYPYIRHEGFTTGFSLADRLRAGGVPYRIAGENIAAVAVSKNFIYQYNLPDSAVECPSQPYPSSAQAGETQQEALDRVQTDLNIFESLLFPKREVYWVNKEWLSVDEIVQYMFTGWYESDGHRKNMLNSSFNEGGIGITQVNDYFIATHVLLKRY